MQRFIIYNLALILSLTALANSSEAALPIQTEQQWERYTGKDENFTASLPAQPSAHKTYRPAPSIDPRHEENYLGTLYHSYSDGIVYLIYSFPRHSEPLKLFAGEFATRFSSGLEVLSAQEVARDGFAGKRYRIKFRGLDGVLDFYVTDNRAFILEVVGGDENNPAVKRFLDSFVIGKPTDSAVIEIKPDAKQSAQSKSGPESGQIFRAQEVSSKAILISRPEPQYTVEAREAHVSGTVILKAVLSSDGQVTNVGLIKSLSHGLNEKAIEAARQMIFIPAMKDGRYVSQSIQIEYSFSVF